MAAAYFLSKGQTLFDTGMNAWSPGTVANNL
jgi:hypothetical protein